MKSSLPRAVRPQAGFTLVELVVVIAILGVLAAVALPRFSSLQGDARASKAQAMLGSVRAAAAQVKAVSIVKGQSCGTASVVAASSPVTLEGVNVALAYCYPSAGADGIVRAANIDATRDGVTLDTSVAGTVVIQVAGASTPANCSVTYTVPAGTDQQPTIASDTSGC